jgi:outer membrane protein
MTKTLLITLVTMTALPLPGAAQGNPFQAFVSRYKPPAHVDVVKASLQPAILSGTLPLTVHDVITLMLENSLDVRVDRLSPLMSRYAVASTFGRFEPSFHLNAGMNHDISGADSQLDGAASLSRLGLDFTFGYSQVLRTGTNIGIDFRANRDSSNSVFNTFNPSYFSSLTYSVRQPVLGGAGRDTSMHPIRVARIDQKMSEVEFEIRLIDSITMAELRYWDLVLGELDMKVQQRSLELAEKTLAGNQHQLQAGTLAPIELVQAEAQVASRHEQILVASYGQDQLQDQMKRLITRTADPARTLTRIEPIEAIHQPVSSDVLPIEQAIRYPPESCAG